MRHATSTAASAASGALPRPRAHLFDSPLGKEKVGKQKYRHHCVRKPTSTMLSRRSHMTKWRLQFGTHSIHSIGCNFILTGHLPSQRCRSQRNPFQTQPHGLFQRGHYQPLGSPLHCQENKFKISKIRNLDKF